MTIQLNEAPQEARMSFAIKNLDHVVVRVADLDRALRFYCDVLGCREERRVASIDLIQLRAGTSMIDLMPADPTPTKAGRNMDHLALRIEPFDEPALRRHLERHGIEAGEVVTRYGAEGNGPSMYIEDPDGNSIELKGPPQL
jgi:catechol 2,3-dioxygenase-like lactoylglutathione lyase family enzyme